MSYREGREIAHSKTISRNEIDICDIDVTADNARHIYYGNLGLVRAISLSGCVLNGEIGGSILPGGGISNREEVLIVTARDLGFRSYPRTQAAKTFQR